jgi:hypothetical protein
MLAPAPSGIRGVMTRVTTALAVAVVVARGASLHAARMRALIVANAPVALALHRPIRRRVAFAAPVLRRNRLPGQALVLEAGREGRYVSVDDIVFGPGGFITEIARR